MEHNAKMDPPQHQLFMWDKKKIPILHPQGWDCIMSYGGISKNGSPPRSNVHVGHKMIIPNLWVWG